VFLLLGSPGDTCCGLVRDGLETRGFAARLLANPLGEPARLSWWLDTANSRSSLVFDECISVRPEELAGVLVLGPALVDPAGWQPTDFVYAQAETQAALLAWLWSLECPVVNRYPPHIWYRPRAPLVAWRRLLDSCGLSMPPTLITNVEDEARGFGREHATGGLEAVAYGPLTSDVRYLVTSADDWEGLAALQQLTPVCLSVPHGEPQHLCVVGGTVIWDGTPSSAMACLEPRLSNFSAAVGLEFLELSLAPVAGEVCVIAVETHPLLHAFTPEAQDRIVEQLVETLLRVA
jgi:hypothetical protein